MAWLVGDDDARLEKNKKRGVTAADLKDHPLILLVAETTGDMRLTPATVDLYIKPISYVSTDGTLRQGIVLSWKSAFA